MQRLQTVLQGSEFREVARFTVRANYNAQEKELIIYRNLRPVAKGPINITTELPIIGRKISGATARE